MLFGSMNAALQPSTTELALLACPDCQSALQCQGQQLVCTRCSRSYQYQARQIIFHPKCDQYIQYYNHDYPDPQFHRRDTAIKLRKILAFLPAEPCPVLLDVGAGHPLIGRKVGAAVQTQLYFFLDVARLALQQFDLQEHEIALLADAQQLPLKNHSVDLTLLVDVLEHLPDPCQALREQQRVARYLLIKAPLDRAFLRRLFLWGLKLIYGRQYWRQVYGHIQQFDRTSLLRLLDQCGFIALKITVTDEPSDSVTPLLRFCHHLQHLAAKLLPPSWFEILWGGTILILARQSPQASSL